MAGEIGGYLELEHFGGELYHSDSIALNCGRGCFAYLVELRDIKTIWLPDFMCGSVPELFQREKVDVRTYLVGRDLLPDYDSFSIDAGEWMLLMDYYGQLQQEDVDRATTASDGRLVVDETQGFFRNPWKGADTVYTCRKWFGVADGGFLSTGDDATLARDIPRDESHARMGWLLGRFERPASEFFAEASTNNDFFACEPAKSMSPITEDILRAIDYNSVRERRNANWEVLSAALHGINGFNLHSPYGAFMYPLYLGRRGPAVRRSLVAEKIYVPVLWPDVKDVPEGFAKELAEGIVPLPVDQRYGANEMETILEVLSSCLN